MLIRNGLVFHPQAGFQKEDWRIEDGCLKKADSQTSASGGEVIDASDCYVLPGLVDIHFHGCAGVDFSDGTREALETIKRYELSRGVTTVCPAAMTLPEEQLVQICRTAAACRDHVLRGIHLEGPFLSEAKRGAQNAAYLRMPDSAFLRMLNREAEGMIRLVSIAPELPGALSCIRECADEFHFSVAHTEADYEMASEAMRLGAMHVTHLWNAMPGFSHRAPGVVGAAFDCGADVELIADGVHVDPCVVRAVFRLFGDDKVILVSDSMRAAGMEDGHYELGGQPVEVKGNRAVLADGTLAGSVTDLFGCMTAAIRMGIDPVSAVKAATFNPARSVGLSDVCGSIREGAPADLLIVSRDWELLTVLKEGKISGNIFGRS